jgi:alanine-glyoxylate transaminase/serine-glyoxylate transaminase/serine-pyruvate transaminase
VLAFNNGYFSHLWVEGARALGISVEEVEADWGQGAPLDALEMALAADENCTIQALLAVHNETSTGVTTSIAQLRALLDRLGHPALLLVDAVSSLGSIDFCFDEWGVDVAITAAQKGLMLPPGMTMLAVSRRAIDAGDRGGAPRLFLDWRPAIDLIHSGYFPFTPPTLLLFGLREALRMLDEEGLQAVYARHSRLAAACREAVREWELETVCQDPSAYSSCLTAAFLPVEIDGAEFLRSSESNWHLSLGSGLGRLKGRVFRIGHLGWLNELELLATLAGVELVLSEMGMPIRLGSGVGAAQRALIASSAGVAQVSA